VFDVALHDAHGRHHHDDGEHTDQHPQQGETRAQRMRKDRAERHYAIFAGFGEQGGFEAWAHGI